MIQTVALIPKEADAETAKALFDRQAESMKQTEGNLSAHVSKGPIMSPGGPTSYQLVLTATWESLDTFMKWTHDPEVKKDTPLLMEQKALLLFFEL